MRCRCLPALSMVEAAAVPETFFTCWQNMFMRATVNSGDWVLVHGGTSGIGTTAIMLAKAFGAKVITTAGSAEKCAAAKKLGADVAVNYKTEDFVAITKDATGGKGANLIVDIVGGDYVDRNYDCAAEQGTIAQVSFTGGPKATANFGNLMRKRLVHTGSTLASPHDFGKGGDRPRHRGQGLAAGCGRLDQAGDRLHLSAGQSRRGPRPHGDERAHRKDRADGVSGQPLGRSAGRLNPRRRDAVNHRKSLRLSPAVATHRSAR